MRMASAQEHWDSDRLDREQGHGCECTLCGIMPDYLGLKEERTRNLTRKSFMKGYLRGYQDRRQQKDFEPRPTKRILITGSRYHKQYKVIRDAILHEVAGYNPFDVTIVSGHCPTGADYHAETVARHYGYQLELHPADWGTGPTRNRAAGPLRNKHMVSLGADVVLAFPIGKSAGTRGCVKFAQEAGLLVKVFEGRI